MMSPISSHKNTIGHTVLVTLKQFFLLPVISIVLFFIIIDLPISATFISQQFSTTSFSNGRNYFLIQNGQGTFLIILICLLAIIYAIAMFRFLYSERAVNTYLSVGCSRIKLFSVRYFFGLISILLGIIISLLISLVFNLLAFPSPYLMEGFWYVITALCVQAFVIYSITSLICVFCGTLVEAAFHSAIFLLAPSMIFSAAEAVLSLMFGSAFSRPITSYYPTSGLVSSLESYNPLLLIYYRIDQFGAPYLSEGGKLSDLVTANYLVLFIWSLISVAIFFLALFVFVWRKAEISGKAGTNKTIGAISSGVIAFYVSSIPFYQYSLPTILKLLIALGIFVIVYFICVLFVNRGIKKFSNYFKGGSVILASCMILVGISLTGGLGYSSYVPNAETVQSAEITYKGSPMISDSGSTYYGWITNSNQSFFTDNVNDIEMITKLHQKIIDAGYKEIDNTVYTPFDKTIVSSETIISYQMKDGNIVNRYYPCLDLKTLTDLLVVEDTDTVKQQLPAIVQDMNDEYAQERQAILTDPFYQNEKKLNLDLDSYTQLLSAIGQDMQEETFEERYYPENDCLAVLIITWKYTEDQYYDPIEMCMPGQGNSKAYYITDKYINTIQFLQQQGFDLTKSITAPAVESIQLIRYTPFPLTDYGWMKESNHPYFQLMKYSPSNLTMYFDELEATPVSPSKYQQVLAATRCSYYTNQGGYIAKIKFQGEEDYLYKFIPEKDAKGLI